MKNKSMFMLAAVVMLASCNSQMDSRRQQQPENSTAFILKKLELEQKHDPPDIAELKKAFRDLPIYGSIQEQLNFSQVEVMKSKTRNVVVYIVRMKDADKRYAVKATRSKALVAESELLFTAKLDKTNSGRIGIMRSAHEALSISFRDGKQSSIQGITGEEYNAYFTQDPTILDHRAFPFCQREQGQSYGDCFKHETEEFCDNFFSCTALATNPHVPILIALTCSCYVPKPENDLIYQPPVVPEPIDSTLRPIGPVKPPMQTPDEQL